MDAEAKEYLNQAVLKAAQWRLPSGENYENSTAADIKVASVIGGGTMGRGMAIALCLAGYETILVEVNDDALQFCRKELQVTIEREVELGRFKKHQVEKLKTLQTTTDFGKLANADLIIEAVFENMQLKKDLFKKLDGICPSTAIFGTNTSSLDIDEISSVLQKPSRLVGIHFFNPAHVIKMVEIVYGKHTGGEAVATAFAACAAMKKLPILVGNCPSFVFNRLLFAYLHQAHKLMYEHGLLPKDVDEIVRSRGFLMGPITMNDMNGIDVGVKVKQEHGVEPNPLEVELMRLGRYGRKNGKGYYKYDPVTRKKANDSEVEELIHKIAATSKKPVVLMCDSHVMDFLLCPMVNEGYLCLEEGIIGDESLIDIMFVLGFGWPPASGGPMRWAKLRGLRAVMDNVRRFHAAEPSERVYKLSKQASHISKL